MRRNNRWQSHSSLQLTLVLLYSSAQAERVDVGRFSSQALNGWQEKSFVDHTRYQLINNGDTTVLKAETSATASGMFREIDIDLKKTPYLNWSWKVDNVYQGNNERGKEGDDYPARVYVIVSGGLLFWNTKAVNYVWSSNQAVGTSWDNAYTDKAKMIAIRSGDDDTDQWQWEKRNVREDLERLFGREFDEINAIAIMSDSDNTQQGATAYYGDIFFTDK